MRKADEMFISSSNWTERVGFVAAIETLKFIKKKKNLDKYKFYR